MKGHEGLEIIPGSVNESLTDEWEIRARGFRVSFYAGKREVQTPGGQMEGDVMYYIMPDGNVDAKVEVTNFIGTGIKGFRYYEIPVELPKGTKGRAGGNPGEQSSLFLRRSSVR